MDMSKYSGTVFIKIDDVREKPLQLRIAGVLVGKYDKPDLVFETGERFSVNATNNRVLVRAFGADSEDWIDRTVELYEGTGEFNGEIKPMVCVRPITQPEHSFGADTPPKKPADKPPKAKAKKNDMDDDVPF